jgi:uncharacterized protein (TIGR02246 family)
MTLRPARRSLFRAGVAAVPLLSATPALAGRAVAAPSDEQPRYQVLTRAFVSRWTTAYLEAWRTKDAAAAVRLFAPDALYEAVPGDESQTYRGRDAIGRYWRDVTSGQSDIGHRQGTPVVTGDRAAVEMWVTLRAPAAHPDGDHWITLIETNVLTFGTVGSERLCTRNSEYWILRTGRHDPPQGWGRA